MAGYNGAHLPLLRHLLQLAVQIQALLGDVAQAASDAITAVADAKADKLSLTALTIPATGWQLDKTGYYIDLSVPGITADDSVAVLIEPDSKSVAEAAALTGTTESRTDTLRLRAWRTPTAAMAAHYYIVREDILMALGPVSMGGSSYVLPPATTTTLGGVIAGSGLSVYSDGTLTVTSVNGFTVKAQTTDPGAGSTLATGTILLVYA